MNLSDEQLKICVDTANELTDHYAVNAHVKCDQKSLDELVRFAQDFLGAPVIMKDLDLRVNASSLFRGVMLWNEDGHYEVFILKDSDESSRRLVTTKELFQVALDEEAVRNMDLYDHVSALLFQDVQDPTPAIIAEQMAEVAAMQFLYPYADRVNDAKRIKNRETTAADISDHYGIPQYYVERYLHAPIMDALRATHLFEVVPKEASEAAN